MSMKKILMAAVAVSALSAGSASALEISKANTTLSAAAVNLVSSSTTVETFTIASESTINAATNIPFTIRVTPTSAALPVSSTYILTFSITGGTFETTGILPSDLTVSGGTGTTVPFTGDVTSTKVQFIVNAGTTTSLATATWVSKGIIPSSDKSSVVVTASIASNASPSQLIDGGAVSATVIDYRTALTFTATAEDQKLSLASGFKKFGTAVLAAGGTADATSGRIGSGIKFAKVTPATGALATDLVYRTTGAEVTATDVTAATLTIGGSLTSLDARVGSGATLQLADASTGVIPLLNATNIAALTSSTGANITLQQKATPVVPSEVTYTVKPTDVVMTAGMIAGTYPAKTIGAVSYEGTNFFAAWITDGAGTSGFKNTIRLGNRSAAAIASVKASLINPLVTGTTGTVASTATCEVGPLPASGELLITSAKLLACFGAFGRSDVRLTIQGNSSDMVAKLRITSPDGSASDTALGTGVTDAAQ